MDSAKPVAANPSDSRLGLLVGGLIAGVVIIAALVAGVLAIQDNNTSVKDVVVTNVTDTAFTLTWVSDSAYIGRVVYQEGESWPFIFAQAGKAVAYDDRDVELDAAGNYVQVEEGAKARFTHHVTVRNLDPETKYSLRIGGAINGKSIEVAPTTKKLIEDINTPDPGYGKVEGANFSDSFLIYSLKDAADNKISVTISNTGTYSLDANFFGQEQFDATLLNGTLRNQSDAAKDFTFTTTNYKPFETIQYSAANTLGLGKSLVQGASAQQLGTAIQGATDIGGGKFQCAGDAGRNINFDASALVTQNGSNVTCAAVGISDGQLKTGSSNNCNVCRTNAAGQGLLYRANCGPCGQAVTNVVSFGEGGDIVTTSQTIPQEYQLGGRQNQGTPGVTDGSGNQIPPDIQGVLCGAGNAPWAGPNANDGGFFCVCGVAPENLGTAIKDSAGGTIASFRNDPRVKGPEQRSSSKYGGSAGLRTVFEAYHLCSGTASPITERNPGIRLPSNAGNLPACGFNSASNSDIAEDLAEITSGFSSGRLYKGILVSRDTNNDGEMDTNFDGRNLAQYRATTILANQYNACVNPLTEDGTSGGKVTGAVYYQFCNTTNVIIPTTANGTTTLRCGAYSEYAAAVSIPQQIASYRICPNNATPEKSLNIGGDMSRAELETISSTGQFGGNPISDLVGKQGACFTMNPDGSAFFLNFYCGANQTVIKEADVNKCVLETAIAPAAPSASTTEFTIYSRTLVGGAVAGPCVGVAGGIRVTDLSEANRNSAANTNKFCAAYKFGLISQDARPIGCRPNYNSGEGFTSNVDSMAYYKNNTCCPTNTANIPDDFPGGDDCAPTTGSQLPGQSLIAKASAATPNSRAAVLGASSSSLEVGESGRYAILAGGEKVSEQDVVVTGDKVEIKLFEDTNANGAKDADEQYLSDYSQISFSREATVTTYNLNSGWNLVHLPLVDNREDNPVDTASALVDYWNSQGAEVKHVTRYRNGQFEMFTQRGEGSEFAKDFDLVPGQALFVFNVGVSTEVTFSGNRATPPVNLNLSNGWNLVGVMPQEQSYTSENLLNKLDEQSFDASTVSQFENGLYQSVIREDDTLFGNNFNIVDTRGYFIKVEDGGGKRFTP